MNEDLMEIPDQNVAFENATNDAEETSDGNWQGPVFAVIALAAITACTYLGKQLIAKVKKLKLNIEHESTKISVDLDCQ
jgi:hypothetical protein